jgi:hypothetical protein
MITQFWIGKHLEGSDSGLTEVISRFLAVDTEENHEKTWQPVRPAEIRTEKLPNKCLKVLQDKPDR